MTCSICHDTLSHEGGVEVRHASDVEESANDCSYCGIILGVLNEHHVRGDQRLHITNDDDTSRTRATHGIKILVIEAGQMYGSQFDFVIRNLKGLDDVASIYNVLYSGCTYTGSSRAFEWAKRQIQACHDTHDTCKFELHAIPDRLLYLGQGDASDPNWLEADAELYESNGENGLYATLSHRWGAKQPLRLLEANLTEFETRIPWSLLPKTFQHAVNFTRRLRVPYLWIDSLCIIQDSKEDWKKQSAKMASIYEHSLITLAASVAENGEEGCFVSPHAFLEGYVTNGTSKAKPNDQQAVLDLVRTANQKAVAFVRGTSEHAMPSGQLPLLRRGWVLQERLLSPRILHFGHVDLIFECSRSIECYCKKQMGAASRNVRSHPPKLQHSNALGHGPFKGVGGHLNAYAERWCAIVEEYTQLELTFASDRLPAVAGLAKQMARYMPEARYMSGVWTERLVVYLSWCRRTYPPTANGPKSRPGPSWNWVTMPGAVRFPQAYFYLHMSVPGSGFQEFADPWPVVVEIEFDHEGEEDSMSLKGGSIKLRGVLLEVRVRTLQASQRSDTGVIPIGSRGPFASVILDHEPENDDLQKAWKDVTPDWAKELETSSTVDAWDLADEYPGHLARGDLESILQLQEAIWAFCLGTWQTDPGGMDQFLLLERIDDLSHAFQRVGFGSCAVGRSLFTGISERQVIVLK